MSFILDALKKSEENRSDNQSPQAGKHVLIPHLPAQKRGALITICVLIPLLSLVGGWWIGRQPEQPAVQASKQSNLATHNTGSQPSVAAPKPTERQPLKADTLAQKSTRLPATAKTQPLNIGAPVPQRRQESPLPATTLPEPVANSKPTAGSEVIIDQTSKIPFYDELSPALQRDLAPLSVSLHFYSSDPARRMLRVNGKIRHEQENITTDLSIVEIREASTLFNYRGTLFELPAPGQ